MSTDNRGDAWLESLSGLPFWPLDLRPEDEMPIEDIAGALANLCRFGGHCPYYSVAEHSVRVAEWVEKQLTKVYAIQPRRVVLAALMHDASEGLGLVDLPRPVKYEVPQYRAIEARAEEWLREKFGLTWELHELVKQGDDVMLATEKRDLKPHGKRDWRLKREPIPPPYRIVPWSPDEARARFMWKYRQVTRVQAKVSE